MEFAFYFASGIAVVSTLRVITNTNPVHALLYLIISLIAVAMTFFSLGAPFAGALEVIAYAGAIMVLFVFVVMMLNLGPVKPGIWIGPVILAALLLAELLYVLFSHSSGVGIGQTTVGAKAVGISLFGPSVRTCWLSNWPRCCCSLQPSRLSTWAATRRRSNTMPAIPLEHGLAVAGILFCLGLVGLMVRRNILFVLMSLEVMMNAAALAFVVAGARWAQPDGQIMFILVISLAAAEASIGLAILLQLYRRFHTLDIDAASEMRG